MRPWPSLLRRDIWHDIVHSITPPPNEVHYLISTLERADEGDGFLPSIYHAHLWGIISSAIASGFTLGVNRGLDCYKFPAESLLTSGQKSTNNWRFARLIGEIWKNLLNLKFSFQNSNPSSSEANMALPHICATTSLHPCFIGSNFLNRYC